VFLADNAVADAVGHAPLQQRMQLRDAGFGQVQLAQRMRPARERRAHRIDSVQALLVVHASLSTGFTLASSSRTLCSRALGERVYGASNALNIGTTNGDSRVEKPTPKITTTPIVARLA